MSDTPDDAPVAAPAAPAEPTKIDFDRAEFAEPAPAHVTCGLCQRAITTEYWQYAGKILCDTCRGAVGRTIADAGRGATMAKAALQGGGVALACGIGYAIFVGVSHFHFALVTIGIGWAVGRTIQKVTRGFGSRKHQVLAVALAYFASTMGYAPDIVRALAKGANQAQQDGASAPGTASTASPPPRSDATDTPAPPEASHGAGNPTSMAPPHGLLASIGLAALILVGIMLAAPFLGISAGLSGILGLLIIFFGLRTAWRVSKGIEASITGPHRVAASRAAGEPAAS